MFVKHIYGVKYNISGNYVDDHSRIYPFEGVTTAPTARKARSNIAFRIKTKYGLPEPVPVIAGGMHDVQVEEIADKRPEIPQTKREFDWMYKDQYPGNDARSIVNRVTARPR